MASDFFACFSSAVASWFSCLHVCVSVVVDAFSLEIILHAEAVESAQAGDKCDFIGTLIVVPDVTQINLPGTSSQASALMHGTF